MERPGSRGGAGLSSSGIGKAPTGSSVPMPDRPGTANRGGGILGNAGPPGTAAGRPPGTASRGGPVGGGILQPPPGTAYKRLGTANQRPGTGQQQGPGGPRTGTAVQVENRPITNHGVSGIRQGGGGGGGRRVLDKNFFLSELRQKRSEIATVTRTMSEELEALEKRQSQFKSMEKRDGDLTKEVKMLQEALADYNCVLDKVGSQTPIYSINADQNTLKERNDMQRRRVDDVLTERLQLESKAKQAENRILELQSSMESRLNSLPPSQRAQYTELMQEQATMQGESKRFEEAIDEMDKTLNTLEGELARNPLKQRSLQLQEQIRTLTERKFELQQEEDRSKMSPEDQREQLMSKIKRDNQEVEGMSLQVRELNDQIKKLELRVVQAQGNTPAVNAAEEAAKREKYEELVAKERDLTNFMDSFPSRKAAKLEEARTRQDTIVSLLDKLSKLQSITTSAMPSQKKFREMQDELEYKRMQLETTQVTQERLKEELVMRRTELDKIDTLEDKIKAELQQLDEKSETLKKNMEKYDNMGDLKEKSEEARVRLEQLKVDLLRRKDLLRSVVSDKALKNQAKKAQLQENNLQISLEKAEQKLRQLNSNIYSMTDFIRTKESETNYKTMAIAITQMADELNGFVKTRV